MEPIRILIADDDAGMRTVMRKLVERVEGYALAGRLPTARSCSRCMIPSGRTSC